VSIVESVILSYTVAYDATCRSIELGWTPNEIRAETLQTEAFALEILGELVVKKLNRVHRTASWFGIEDALAGRPMNLNIEDFGEIEPWWYESPSCFDRQVA
jgi:hypothetical protein